MENSFTKASITTEYAQELLRKAEAKAKEMGIPSVIVIADESGVVKLSSRMDGAGIANAQVATDKAFSAAVTGVATELWQGIADGDPALGFGLASIDRLCPIGGGKPILSDEMVIGGIGISGGTVTQDLEMVEAVLPEA
jgi:glc operon protein GlcG